MEIGIGSDHGGYILKEQLIKYLEAKSFVVKDFGTNSQESVNYAGFGHKVAEYVAKTKNFGIVICGSGIGISIAANRHKNVRAALIRTQEEARLTREHNDANVLALGGRFTSFEEAKKIVDTFLETKFEGGRHQCRIEEIDVQD